MRILHLADLHINTARHSPRAYHALFKQINAVDRHTTVICGDVFDGAATPDDMLVFVSLVTGINTPLILILGNHDCDLRVPGRTNTVAAMLAAYPTTATAFGAVYTLANTTVYLATQSVPFRIGAVAPPLPDAGCNVTGVLPAGERPPLNSRHDADTPTVLASPGGCDSVWFTMVAAHAPTCPPGELRGLHGPWHVALVHAPAVPAVLISAYDLVLAGDIHARRFVAPTAAYAGSPLQVTIAEPSVRGGIVWTLDTVAGSGAPPWTSVDAPPTPNANLAAITTANLTATPNANLTANLTATPNAIPSANLTANLTATPNANLTANLTAIPNAIPNANTAATLGLPDIYSLRADPPAIVVSGESGPRWHGTPIDFPSKYGYAKYIETVLQPGYVLPSRP